MCELTGYLTTHEDWFFFAHVVDDAADARSGRSWDGESVAEWLSEFPDGSRVTITVEPLPERIDQLCLPV